MSSEECNSVIVRQVSKSEFSIRSSSQSERRIYGFQPMRVEVSESVVYILIPQMFPNKICLTGFQMFQGAIKV